MKVKISKEKIWWYCINENKPSKKYMDVFKKRMELTDLKIKFIDINNVEIVSKNRDITYIWLNHMGKDYFYIVKGIDTILNNAYILSVELDLWNTFTLPYLENMKKNNVEVLCKRSHLFNEKSIQYDDELLDSVFKQYESVDLTYKELDYDAGFYHNSSKNAYIDRNAINSNMCFVFKEGDSLGNYTYIPVLSKDSNINIKFKKTSKFYGLRYEFIDRIYYIYEVVKIGTKLSYYVLGSYKNINDATDYLEKIRNNKKCNYYYYNCESFEPYEFNSFILYKNKTSDTSKNLMIFNSWDPAMDSKNTKLIFDYYYNDIKVASYTYTYKNYNLVIPPGKQGYVFAAWLIEILDDDTLFSKQVYNSLNNINLLRISQEYSNKFLGVYFIPNSLLLGDYWNVKNIKGHDYLLLDISYEIKKITFITTQLKYDNNLRYNSEIIGNKNILKYIYFKYYNNNLDLRYFDTYYDEKNKKITFYLNSYFYFSNCFNLISKFKLKSLKYGVLSLPGPLPLGVDSYINYVNATKNSIDAGYNIVKQNSIVNGVFGSLAGLGKIIMGGIGLSGGFEKVFLTKSGRVRKNQNPNYYLNQNANYNRVYTGSTGDMMDMGNSIFGGVLQIGHSITSSVLSVSQFENKVKADYKDKNNVLGNEICDAQNLDAMWLLANRIENTQYEPFEIYRLTKNCIKSLNNIIYLYGEYYPQWININKVLDVGIGENNVFRFIQLDNYYLSLNTLQYLDAPREYYEDVLNELEKGVRLIDNIEMYYESIK